MWVRILTSFFIRHVNVLGVTFLIHKNGDSIICLMFPQKEWLRITEVEVAITPVFPVVTQRSGTCHCVYYLSTRTDCVWRVLGSNRLVPPYLVWSGAAL